MRRIILVLVLLFALALVSQAAHAAIAAPRWEKSPVAAPRWEKSPVAAPRWE